MSEKAPWTNRINEIIFELEHLPKGKLISTGHLQQLLDCRPRAAQEILQPIVTEKKGKSGLAPKEAVICRLMELVGLDIGQERSRRLKVADWLDGEKEKLKRNPRLLVEAPNSIVNAAWEVLEKAGVEFGPGFVKVNFQNPEQAKKLFLGIAMAWGRDEIGFETKTKTEGLNNNAPAGSMTLDQTLDEGAVSRDNLKPLCQDGAVADGAKTARGGEA